MLTSPEAMRRLVAHPETNKLMQDPEFQKLFSMVQANPQLLSGYSFFIPSPWIAFLWLCVQRSISDALQSPPIGPAIPAPFVCGPRTRITSIAVQTCFCGIDDLLILPSTHILSLSLSFSQKFTVFSLCVSLVWLWAFS
jgi:hypothetical protein